MLKYIFLIIFFSFTSVFADQIVKIGVLAKRSPQITLEKYSSTAAYLSKEIKGYKFKIVPLSFEQLKESVKNKEIDFVLTNTMYYVELEYHYGISRIATLKNISSDGKETTSFGGVIIAREGSNINSFKDLRGKRFGAVDPLSLGGWVMALKEFKDNHIDVNDFSSFKFFGSHDKVVQAVCNGEIDAGTVRSDTLERMKNEGIITSKCYRVIEPKHYKDFPFAVSTRLYPEWPFAKLSTTSEKLSNKVSIALLKMSPDSQAAKDSNVAGWTIPLDYTAVHQLLQDLQLGPYEELGKLTLGRFFEKYRLIFYSLITIFILVISVLLYIYKLNARLKDSNQYIEALNANLEMKVQERTSEIEKMYLHEKYLKNILETIADINELLITSLSTGSVVENSIDRLVKNEHYCYVWMGLEKNNTLEMSIQCRGKEKAIEKSTYNLDSADETLAFKLVQKAVKYNETVIEKLPDDYTFELGNDHYGCDSCWLVSIPITVSNDDTILGTLSVFSDNKDGFEPQEVKMLENLSTDIGLALNSIYQNSKLQYMELEKISNYEETILAFVNIIEQRDSYTAGHTIRVARYCRLLAEGMGVNNDDILKLEKAAILHDIGKVVTPDSILLKPGNLTQLEYELIKEHANAGYKMLSKIKMYKDLADIIRYHHARYDGTGYPVTDPKHPEAIPLLSYIMMVADAFDAMTTNRIYKPRKSIEEALEEIKLFSGKQFHPDVAEAALKVLKNIDISTTSQMPKNELEERRFAYFFRDSLTEVYNETYLQIILNKITEKQRYLYQVDLKNFSDYNKRYGWKEGDKFLKRIAERLTVSFPDCMIFRYHGDDFILLFKTYTVVTEDEIKGLDIFKESGIIAELIRYDLNERIPEL